VTIDNFCHARRQNVSLPGFILSARLPRFVTGMAKTTENCHNAIYGLILTQYLSIFKQKVSMARFGPSFAMIPNRTTKQAQSQTLFENLNLAKPNTVKDWSQGGA